MNTAFLWNYGEMLQYFFHRYFVSNRRIHPKNSCKNRESREIRFIFEETVINIDYYLIESQTGDQLILMRFPDQQKACGDLEYMQLVI